MTMGWESIFFCWNLYNFPRSIFLIEKEILLEKKKILQKMMISYPHKKAKIKYTIQQSMPIPL